MVLSPRCLKHVSTSKRCHEIHELRWKHSPFHREERFSSFSFRLHWEFNVMSQFYKQMIQVASREYPEFLYGNISGAPNGLEQDLKLNSPDSPWETVIVMLINPGNPLE